MKFNKQLRSRVESLEKRLNHDPIILHMPGGRTQVLPCYPGYLLDLALSALDGVSTPEVELIVQSESAIEPGGGHLLDFVRCFWRDPNWSESELDDEIG